MKRYWKTILLSTFIVVTFGVLYISQQAAENDLPELELVTINGDEEITENLVIYGNYRLDPLMEPFELSDEGMMYFRNVSYLERLGGFYHNPVLERLIEEERGFMRGKEDYIEHLFENNEVIAQVEPLGVKQFGVDILDKTSGNVQSFSTEIPEQEFHQLYVREVQLLDGTLFVITGNMNVDVQDVHVYEIDLQNETIGNHYSIAELSSDNYTTDLNFYFDISPQEYYVVRIDDVERDEQLQYEEIVDTEILVHQLSTRETETIELPEDLLKGSHDPPGDVVPEGNFSVGEEHIHFFYFSDEGLVLQSYHLANKKLGEASTIPLDTTGIVEGVYPFGKNLYVISKGKRKHDDRKLIGIDLVNADVIYEGKIAVKQVSPDIGNFEIYDFYAQ